MDKQVVVGAGPVGRSVVEALAGRDVEVVVASRSGTGPEIPGATRVAVDASDPEALSEVAAGASVLYNCVNPPSYTTWTRDWPPIAHALLAAAERSGAVLAVTGNLYPYGPTADGRMVEGMPDAGPGTKARIRATMTADALAAHRAGRIRTVEVRGSDFLGAGPGDYGHVPRAVEMALAGKTPRVIGSAQQPHSWTDVRDMGRALVLLAGEESAHGRVWHAPTNPARTQADAVNDVLATIGHAPVSVKAYPRWVLPVAGMVVPMMRELRETEYQFTGPYVMESAAVTAAYGLEPSAWEDSCRRTARPA